MTTAPAIRTTTTRRLSDRTGLLAGVSALIAAGSIAITLAMTSGDDSPQPATPASDIPAATHAHPLQGPDPGERAAERFHHFR